MWASSVRREGPYSPFVWGGGELRFPSKPLFTWNRTLFLLGYRFSKSNLSSFRKPEALSPKLRPSLNPEP